MDTPPIRKILRDLLIDVVDYKPVDKIKITERLCQISQSIRIRDHVSSPLEIGQDAADVIEAVLGELEMPDHFKGYLFAKTALFFLLDKPLVRGALYDVIASVNKCTRFQAEKNLRTAIEACINSEMYQSLFGCKRVANIFFLHKISNVVKQRLRSSKPVDVAADLPHSKTYSQFMT